MLTVTYSQGCEAHAELDDLAGYRNGETSDERNDKICLARFRQSSAEPKKGGSELTAPAGVSSRKPALWGADYGSVWRGDGVPTPDPLVAQKA